LEDPDKILRREDSEKRRFLREEELKEGKRRDKDFMVEAHYWEIGGGEFYVRNFT